MGKGAILLALLAAGAAGCATRHTRQLGGAYVLKPAEVRARSVATGDLRTLRVRAYADADYQGHAPEWRERIAAQVGRASAVLEGEFAVRLEVESVRAWARRDPTPSLKAALAELIELDRASDVDWVVGYVGEFVEDGTDDSGGRAPLFGRHMVLRVMDRPDSAASAAQSWDLLSDEERAEMLRSWREHAETSALLHEWGHTLGAVHECVAKWIMAPRSTLLQAAFSPGSRRLARVGLEHRGGTAPDVIRRWADAYRAEAANLEAAAWDCQALADGLALAQRLLDARAEASARPR